MGELVSGFEPVDEVEVEVVAARAAVEDQRQNGDERGERDKKKMEAFVLKGCTFRSCWLLQGSSPSLARERVPPPPAGM